MAASELLDGGRVTIAAAYNEKRNWAWSLNRDPIDAAGVVQGLDLGRGESVVIHNPGGP